MEVQLLSSPLKTMIEVEKQFEVDEAARKRLIAGAEFVGEVKNHDTYYDTADYALTTKDIWLRNRNGRFELKLSVNETRPYREGQALGYEEIEEEGAIRQRLDLPRRGNLETDLAEVGYVPFGGWVVTRTKYKKGDFGIDFDSVDFGYEIVEIELMVAEGSDLAAASQRIVAFAEEHGLSLKRVDGKKVAYLLRHNKPHFDALVAAGIAMVREK